MRVVGREILEAFGRKHADAVGSVNSWLAEAKDARWAAPHDVQHKYPKASILKGSRCVFNIHGNRYRLITIINYSVGVVRVRWIGTHADYDRIDAETI